MIDVRTFDGFLDAPSHRLVRDFLAEPGWRFGAYSDDRGQRYHYKHFAGYSASGTEERSPGRIADELHEASALLFRMWTVIRDGLLPGHLLSRCYANRMDPGIGGGLHRDSPIASHVTAIYYPDLAWAPADAGETLFFDEQERNVVCAVTPLPNRLVLFSGVIPHVARARSPRSEGGRITLMFKTLGPAAQAA